MEMAFSGLLLTGLGGGCAYRFPGVILAEITENKTRQKMGIGLDVVLSVSSIAFPVTFWLIGHWRIVIIICLLLPSLAYWLLLVFYIE